MKSEIENSPKQFSRRQVLTFLSGLGGVAVLGACVPQETAKTPEKGRVTMSLSPDQCATVDANDPDQLGAIIYDEDTQKLSPSGQIAENNIEIFCGPTIKLTEDNKIPAGITISDRPQS